MLIQLGLSDSESKWCFCNESDPRRRDIVQLSLLWESGDAHCWVCKQVTYTHWEGWINTPPPPPPPLPPPPPPLFSLHPRLLPSNLWPLRNPSSPLCGDTAEPSILSPPILLASLLRPSTCLFANAVIMLRFTSSSSSFSCKVYLKTILTCNF